MKMQTLGIWAVLLFWAAFANAEIVQTYRFELPQLTTIHQDLDTLAGDEEYTLINLKDSPVAGQPGSPLIPHHPVTLIIPQNELVTAVDVVASEWIELPGTHILHPSQKEYPLSSTESVHPTAPDSNIYGLTTPFPAESHSTPKSFWCKGYQLFTFNLFPVRYIPASGRLSIAQNMEVRVQTSAGSKPAGVVKCRATRSDLEWVQRKVQNPDLAESYISELDLQSNPSRDEFKYVLITSQAIAGMAGPNNFQDLLTLKNNRGITTTIKTLEEISSQYPGTDLQTKIRNFCIFAYENWNTDWVLLGADHNVLPTRGCYATGEGEEDSTIPTDMYYGCLDGTWDNSGNGIYGEINDGPAGGDPDVFAELFIGRASVDSVTQLHNFVSKTITYETDNYSQEWADNVLLLGEYLWPATYGDYYMNELWHGSSECGYTTPGYPETWDIDRLYASEGSWGSDDLIPRLNSNDLFWVNHLGHANETSVMEMYTSDVDGLTNSRPFLVYSQGCYAGAFDTTDCIAEHFSWATHGAFAVLMNGRYGWGEIGSTDGSSQYFHRQFHDAYFTEGIREIGKMNQDSKEDNVWCLDYKSNRWCCYEVNLLGCPQTPINGINTNRGTLNFDKTKYGANSTLTATVTDIDLNLNPGAIDHTEISLELPGGSDLETLILTETSVSSCIFTGSIPVTAGPYNPWNDVIEVQELDVITGIYIDESDGFGGVSIPRTDSATADFTEPVISSVEIDFLDDHSVVITWTTDEPADSFVEYDTITPPSWGYVHVNELTTQHSVRIQGLEQCLDYYFYVMSSDDAGNETTDDAGGTFYHFTTMIRLYVLNEPMDSNPGWTITGGDWQFGDPTGQPSGAGHDPSAGFDGPNVYGTNISGAYGSGTYHLITPALDCSAAFNTTLSFYRWLAVDGTDNGDNASVSISTNGTTWTTLYQNCPSNFYEYRWTKVSYDISGIADGQPQVYIRWTMGPGGPGTVGGWNIDNVELSYAAPCNVPILMHLSHEIDDSSGNNDGVINPEELIDLSVVLRNVGLDATNISTVLDTDYPHIVISQNSSLFDDIVQGGTGESISDYTFMVTSGAQDGDQIIFDLNWTCDQETNTTSFIETVATASLKYDSLSILDMVTRGDGDGIFDPGETIDMTVNLKNEGHLAAQNLSGTLSVDHPEYVTISAAQSNWPDIAPGDIEGSTAPYFTVTADPSVPDHTYVQFTLDLEGEAYSTSIVFDVEITTSTFTRRYYYPMDTDPGWSCEGLWQFGQPQGIDSDPSSGYTGNNVYGYNLQGEYEDSIPVYSLTSLPMNCSIFSNVEVRFMRWLGIESSSYDHATFDISTDGSTWNTIWSHSGASFTDPTWIPQVFDISQYADGASQVQMRWTMGPTDSSVAYCGWNIDDVEIWAETTDPRPVLEHQSHEIDDSSGNDDGHINPAETVDLDITAHNYGLSGTNISAFISSTNPNVSFPVNSASFEDIPANANGSTVTPFTVQATESMNDGEVIPITITWSSDEGNGSFGFNEEVFGPAIDFASLTIIDPISNGDGDGILDPGESAQLMVTLANDGRMGVANVTGELTSNQPSYVQITDSTAVFNDLPAGQTASSIDPHFAVQISPDAPENLSVTFDLTISADNYSVLIQFQSIITESTFTKRYSWNLDSNPGWTCEGEWAWGIPAGSGGDPSSGYTGANVYGYNLQGAYPNGMQEMSLTSNAINCSNLSNVEIRFMRWLGVESSSYDHAYFRVSVDGSTWATVWSHSGSTMTETSWSAQVYDLSSYADGQANVYLRWTMGTTDSSLTYCGWNLDDIEIWAESASQVATPTPGPMTPTRTPTWTPTPMPATSTPTLTPSITPSSTTTTPIFTPTETHTPVVDPTPVPPTYTNTPIATSTPNIDPTSTPTSTLPPASPTPTSPSHSSPTPTPTSQSPASPTPTATELPERGMYVFMDDIDLAAGDTFHLYFQLSNPENSQFNADVYLLLGIGNEYWCWPSWVSLETKLDFSTIPVPAAHLFEQDVLSFEWPSGISPISGMQFIGAMFEEDTWNLIGSPQVLVWQCH